MKQITLRPRLEMTDVVMLDGKKFYVVSTCDSAVLIRHNFESGGQEDYHIPHWLYHIIDSPAEQKTFTVTDTGRPRGRCVCGGEYEVHQADEGTGYFGKCNSCGSDPNNPDHIAGDGKVINQFADNETDKILKDFGDKVENEIMKSAQQKPPLNLRVGGVYKDGDDKLLTIAGKNGECFFDQDGVNYSPDGKHIVCGNMNLVCTIPEHHLIEEVQAVCANNPDDTSKHDFDDFCIDCGRTFECDCDCDHRISKCIYCGKEEVQPEQLKPTVTQKQIDETPITITRLLDGSAAIPIEKQSVAENAAGGKTQTVNWGEKCKWCDVHASIIEKQTETLKMALNKIHHIQTTNQKPEGNPFKVGDRVKIYGTTSVFSDDGIFIADKEDNAMHTIKKVIGNLIYIDLLEEEGVPADIIAIHYKQCERVDVN